MARVRAVWVLAVLVVAACERSEEPAASAPEGAATAEQSAKTAVDEPVLEPEIANAVAEASEQAMAATGASGGPPPDGILGKQKADAEAPAGAPAKLTVGSTGQGTKLRLSGGVSQKRSGRAEIAVRTGPRSALPSIDLALEVAPPKGEPTSPADYAIRVVDSKLAAQQPGQIPERVEEQVRALKGSSFQYTIRDGMPVGSPRHELAKGADSQLGQILQAASDLLSSTWIAVPEQPVGQGAFWMTTSRETFAGSDVVAYRMVTVKSLTPERAELEVKTRRYSAGGGLGVLGLDQGSLRKFQGEDTAQLVLVPGNPLPVEAQIKQSLLAIVEDQGRAAPVQFDARATLEFPAGAP